MKIKWLTLLLIWCLSNTAIAQDPCARVDIDWLNRHIPLPPEARLVFKQASPPLCEAVIALDGDLIPVYAGKDFALVGKLFKKRDYITGNTLASLDSLAKEESLKHGQMKILKREQRNEFLRLNIHTLETLTSFSFKPEKAENHIYLITDPNCSHCKALLPELELIAMEKRTELKVVIYPLRGEQSRDMAVSAICQGKSYQAYKSLIWEPGIPVCDTAKDRLKQTNSFFSSMELGFVPVVVAGDGSWVVEGNDPGMVRNHLGMKPVQPESSNPGACGPGE